MLESEDFPRSYLKEGVKTLDKIKKSVLSRFQKNKANKPSKIDEEDISDGIYGSKCTDDVKLPTLDSITPGTLVLGSVALVCPSGLRIHILNNIVGFAKYSDLFDSADSDTNNGDLANDRDNRLSSPIKIGSTVICYVLKVNYSYLSLSLKPSLINRDLRVDNIYPGLILPATVTSQEDHGLSITFNSVSGLNGFIMYDEQGRESVKSILKSSYPINSTVNVAVVTVNAERGFVKCQWPWLYKTPIDTEAGLVFDTLKPGLLLKAEVLNVHNIVLEGSSKSVFAGYTVKCLGSINETISSLHSFAQTNISNEVEMEDFYSLVGETVECRIIQVDFENKKLHMSMQSQILKWKGPMGQAFKPINNKIINCKITQCFSSGFLLESIPPTGDDINNSDKRVLHCYCAIHDVLDDKSLTEETIFSSSKYSVGSVHECRVIEFDYFTRLTRVSMKSSLISEEYVTPFELSASDVVKGKIINLVNSGAIVQISSLVFGKVPLGHLTQVPVTKLPEGLKVGRNLRLRVLKFDHAHNKLILTAKGLMLDDTDPVVKFEQLHVGKKLIGYVTIAKDTLYTTNGLDPQSANSDELEEPKVGKGNQKIYVKFYNELKTVLSPEEVKKAKELSMDLNTDSVVKCAVTRVDRAKKVFSVTLDELKISKLLENKDTTKKPRREKRKLLCKQIFKDYKSKKKLKKN
ncbi:rna-associated protein, putative [Theileria annulata]|uniref:Rna-associated protein, putative n=1 Tax=Theileria annulata TaxID=5874 RepID=Q4UGH7_THEAN|nr:rna-associated protein, putative [Theileria annulata]CAI73812.1 rna-associated protein, putative [Theileria annulata]|eukprot:XP_954489.1 rna-associated protein, putative [Theileria annulata]